MSDQTKMSPASQISRAIAHSSSAEAADGCFICQKTLWVSVFFDESGHDIEREKGTEKASNIGKLLLAHAALNPSRGIYPLYYNGLGVALNAPNIARRQTAKESSKEEAEKIAKDKLKEYAS